MGTWLFVDVDADAVWVARAERETRAGLVNPADVVAKPDDAADDPAKLDDAKDAELGSTMV